MYSSCITEISTQNQCVFISCKHFAKKKTIHRDNFLNFIKACISFKILHGVTKSERMHDKLKRKNTVDVNACTFFLLSFSHLHARDDAKNKPFQVRYIG